MKSIARSVRVLAVTLCAFSAMPAFAEQSRGFYMGVGAGNANSNVSAGDMNQLFRDAFRAQGATFTPQTATIDNKDSSLYIFAGYRVFPWLSAEGGYINLGGFDYRSTGTIFGPGIASQQITARMEVKSQGVAVSALGNLPLSDYFELHARVGFFGVNTDATASGGSASRPVSSSDSGISFSAQFGLGAGVNLGKHFSLSADWVHFFQIDSGEDNDGYEYDGYDVDVMRVSAIVRF